MRTKTYSLGEWCIGGRIKIVVNKTITVQCLDWDTKKVVDERMFNDDSCDLECYLTEVSTSYYADKMMSWINKDKLF